MGLQPGESISPARPAAAIKKGDGDFPNLTGCQGFKVNPLCHHAHLLDSGRCLDAPMDNHGTRNYLAQELSV